MWNIVDSRRAADGVAVSPRCRFAVGRKLAAALFLAAAATTQAAAGEVVVLTSLEGGKAVTLTLPDCHGYTEVIGTEAAAVPVALCSGQPSRETASRLFLDGGSTSDSVLKGVPVTRTQIEYVEDGADVSSRHAAFLTASMAYVLAHGSVRQKIGAYERVGARGVPFGWYVSRDLDAQGARIVIDCVPTGCRTEYFVTPDLQVEVSWAADFTRASTFVRPRVAVGKWKPMLARITQQVSSLGRLTH